MDAVFCGGGAWVGPAPKLVFKATDTSRVRPFIDTASALCAHFFTLVAFPSSEETKWKPGIGGGGRLLLLRMAPESLSHTHTYLSSPSPHAHLGQEDIYGCARTLNSSPTHRDANFSLFHFFAFSFMGEDKMWI